MKPAYRPAFLCTVASWVPLFFGVTLPMIAIDISGHLKSQLGNFDQTVLHKSQSIIETISELYSRNVNFAATLILLFSFIVPIGKGLLTVWVCTSERAPKRFLGMISKWSMADVFVVAIFIAYLSTQGQGEVATHDISIMGFELAVELGVMVKSQLLSGFYAFAGYCLLSNLGVALLQKNAN